MPRALRLGLGALGLAAVVYGAASLTGGWLGKPLWWGHWESANVNSRIVEGEYRTEKTWDGGTMITEVFVPLGGREAISVVVTFLGLLLLAWSALPRAQHASGSD